MESGVASFDIDVSLLSLLEDEVRNHLVGRPEFLAHLQQAMHNDKAYHVVHTRGAGAGQPEQRWGYTKSGVTTATSIGKNELP